MTGYGLINFIVTSWLQADQSHSYRLTTGWSISLMVRRIISVSFPIDYWDNHDYSQRVYWCTPIHLNLSYHFVLYYTQLKFDYQISISNRLRKFLLHSCLLSMGLGNFKRFNSILFKEFCTADGVQWRHWNGQVLR